MVGVVGVVGRLVWLVGVKRAKCSVWFFGGGDMSGIKK